MSLNGSAPLRCGCSMGALWAFAGEGYLHRSYTYATGCVDHDVTALRAEQLINHAPNGTHTLLSL